MTGRVERSEPLYDARPSRMRLLPPVARAAADLVGDRLRRTPAPGKVPVRPDRLPQAWLDEALCAGTGNRVLSCRYEQVSAGTSVRGRLRLRYADDDAPGVPRTVFVKSTPTLMTRLANGVTGTSAAEAEFFTALRPALDGVAIPHGYRSEVDPVTLRSIHLLEDLTETVGATFPDATTVLTREQAFDAIDLLADVHRTLAGAETRQIPTYPQWWRRALSAADVRGAIRKYVRHAPGAAAVGTAEQLWRMAIASVLLHERLPSTIMHGDPHLGNWYVKADGGMGLLDWQCVSRGHWARDVSYAVVTLLSTEQRRAWERDLVEHHRSRSGFGESVDEAWLHYRQQVPGALLMWAPTLHPPAGFPDTQPRELAERMVARISAAIEDLESGAALAG